MTRSAARNVDVMPRTILAFTTHVVRPGGSVRQQVAKRKTAIALEFRINQILRKELPNQLLGFRGEVLFGDQRHGLMAFASPGVGGWCPRNHIKEEKERNAGEESNWAGFALLGSHLHKSSVKR